MLPIAASHLQELGCSLAELPFPADLSSNVLLGKCKAIWARNALVLNKAERWSRLLHDAGVEAVSIKGVVSISRDPVLARGRQTLDVDLFVPPEQWELAEEVLKRSGDFREYDAPMQWSEGRGWMHVHAQHWRGDGIDLDLHRHPQPGFLKDSRPYALIQPHVKGQNGVAQPQTGDHLAIQLTHAFSHTNASSGACLRYIAEALRTFPEPYSIDYTVMKEQLARHDNGTKAQKQLQHLKKTIENGKLDTTKECKPAVKQIQNHLPQCSDARNQHIHSDWQIF